MLKKVFAFLVFLLFVNISFAQEENQCLLVNENNLDEAATRIWNTFSSLGLENALSAIDSLKPGDNGYEFKEELKEELRRKAHYDSSIIPNSCSSPEEDVDEELVSMGIIDNYGRILDRIKFLEFISDIMEFKLELRYKEVIYASLDGCSYKDCNLKCGKLSIYLPALKEANFLFSKDSVIVKRDDFGGILISGIDEFNKIYIANDKIILDDFTFLFSDKTIRVKRDELGNLLVKIHQDSYDGPIVYFNDVEIRLPETSLPSTSFTVTNLKSGEIILVPDSSTYNIIDKEKEITLPGGASTRLTVSNGVVTKLFFKPLIFLSSHNKILFKDGRYIEFSYQPSFIPYKVERGIFEDYPPLSIEMEFNGPEPSLEDVAKKENNYLYYPQKGRFILKGLGRVENIESQSEYGIISYEEGKVSYFHPKDAPVNEKISRPDDKKYVKFLYDDGEEDVPPIPSFAIYPEARFRFDDGYIDIMTMKVMFYPESETIRFSGAMLSAIDENDFSTDGILFSLENAPEFYFSDSISQSLKKIEYLQKPSDMIYDLTHEYSYKRLNNLNYEFLEVIPDELKGDIEEEDYLPITNLRFDFLYGWFGIGGRLVLLAPGEEVTKLIAEMEENPSKVDSQEEMNLFFSRILKDLPLKVFVKFDAGGSLLNQAVVWVFVNLKLDELKDKVVDLAVHYNFDLMKEWSQVNDLIKEINIPATFIGERDIEGSFKGSLYIEGIKKADITLAVDSQSIFFERIIPVINSDSNLRDRIIKYTLLHYTRNYLDGGEFKFESVDSVKIKAELDERIAEKS